MRTKHNHLLRKRIGSFGTVAVVCIGFTTRPSGDSMLQIIEDLYVYIVSRTVNTKQFAQAVFAVIFICKFQDRFFGKLTQPYDGTSYQLIVPIAICNQPGMAD